MISINSVQIEYMGRSTTLESICKYNLKNIRDCSDLSQVGAIAYMHSIIERLKFSSIDEAMEQADEYPEYINFIATKVVIDNKITEVDGDFIALLNEIDADEKRDMLYSFLMKNLK
jgi:hypothetical protein